jgi:AcrR family transcriptional regulator
MPLPRFEKLGPTQREGLLTSATAEFARHGYADASLNQILKDAGLSKGTLYYYFADRDDLYAFVVLQAGLALREGIAFEDFDPKTKEEFEPALDRLARLAVEVIKREPEKTQALRSFQRDLRRNPKPAFTPLIELTRETFRQIVRRGRKFGLVRDDLPEALLIELLESADEVLDRSLYAGKRVPTGPALERHVVLIRDTFRRLLAPPTQPRSSS